MATVFPNIAHCTYKNSFLQRVLVEFQYESISSQKSNLLSNVWEKYFGQIITEKQRSDFFSVEGTRIKKQDESVRILLQQGICILQVEIEHYKSFNDSILSYVELLKSFLSEINCSLIKVTIRKINLWPFNIKEGKELTPNAVLKTILSNNLLNNKDKKKLFDDIDNIYTLSLKENDTCVEIKFGYLQMSSDIELSRVVLDTSAIIDFNPPVNTQELTRTKFDELNHLLFNVYHWCVNPMIINLMKGDSK